MYVAHRTVAKNCHLLLGFKSPKWYKEITFVVYFDVPLEQVLDKEDDTGTQMLSTVWTICPTWMYTNNL